MEEVCCMYCQTNIFGPRVKCAECTDLILCLQCFACGVEAERHKKDHNYQVLTDVPLISFKDWRSNEEEFLVEGVEQFGFGNWEDVARHVSTRSAEECKEHYFNYYISGTLGKVTFRDHKRKKVVEHTGPPEGPLSPSITTPIRAVELSVPEQQELGYLPLRDDFEKEYDNDAETMISNLLMNYDDEDIDITFKIGQVEMYRLHLKERERRKAIAREYKLIRQASTIGMKKHQADKRKCTKEQMDLKDKLKVFAQFHSKAEHDSFLENRQKEKRIKSRIKELMKCRKSGISKLDDLSKLESSKRKREKKEAKPKNKATSSTGSKSQTAMATTKRQDVGKDIIFIGDSKTSTGSKTGDSSKSMKLLSVREKKLCKSLNLKPDSYITIKTCIIKDYLNRRQGSPVKFRYPSHLDMTHRRRILSFLCESGWIAVAS